MLNTVPPESRLANASSFLFFFFFLFFSHCVSLSPLCPPFLPFSFFVSSSISFRFLWFFFFFFFFFFFRFERLGLRRFRRIRSRAGRGEKQGNISPPGLTRNYWLAQRLNFVSNLEIRCGSGNQIAKPPRKSAQNLY